MPSSPTHRTRPAGRRTARRRSPPPKSIPPPRGITPLPCFEGDARDQRSWTSWCTDWLREARKVTKPGGIACIFIDWRQLPSLADAFQQAGWTWRGLAVWDKLNSRPQIGRFRQQTEYILWGSNGDIPVDRGVPCLPGIFSYANEAQRWHQTVKPLNLMREIVRICAPGGLILDPFAGSGTTVLAAQLEGYMAVGVEAMEEYVQIARERLETQKNPAIASSGNDKDRI